MRLAELLMRRKYIERKIEQLQSVLCNLVQSDKTSQSELSLLRTALYESLEKSQHYSMQIDSANTQIELSVGNTQVTLDKAIHIRRTLKRKLDSASDLINNSSGNVDIHSFLTQRDAFYEEFLMLDKTIKMLEWSATLD